MTDKEQQDLIQRLTEFASYLKGKHRPALDLFLDSVFESGARQFVFELQAILKLDEDSQTRTNPDTNEPFKDAADEKLYLIQKERSDKAKADAEAKAVADAIANEEKAKQEKIAAEAEEARLKHLTEIAHAVAQEKADKAALASANAMAQQL